MRIIDSEGEKTIILKDGEEVNIMTLTGNSLKIKIQCEDGVLIVDEITEQRNKETKVEKNQRETSDDLTQKGLE